MNWEPRLPAGNRSPPERRSTESSREHVRASPVISVLVAAAAGYGISKLLGARGSK